MMFGFMRELVNRQTGAAVLSVLVCSTLAWLLLGAPTSGIDDADVFLVYARNFADGYGFVYNIGGEQVEGFSSLLWMLVCSAFFLVSRAVEVPLFLLNLLFGIITIYICLKRSDQKPTFLVLLCSAPAWFAWCQIALMESGLWCMLLTMATLAVSERRVNQCALLLPLLMLTRPESMLWGCWLILLLFLGFGLERGWRAGLRAVFRPAFTYGTVWAVLLLFRGHYFGYLLPNTYYAKVSHDLQLNIESGGGYLLGYLFSSPGVLLVLLVFAWVCVREVVRKRWLSRQLTVGLCLLPGLGIPLVVGGDRLGAFRFYQPIWPLLCLVAAWAMPLLYNRLNRLFRRLVPLALLAAGWLIFALTANLKHEFRMAREGREQGAVLARMFEGHVPPPTIAVITAGGHKYTYPGHVYDLMGLNATEMAHAVASKGGNKNHTGFNSGVFYEWYPDILIRGDSEEFDQWVFKGLQSEPLFKERYDKGELWYNDEQFSAYFSRRFIEGLEEGFYAFNPDLQYALTREDG